MKNYLMIMALCISTGTLAMDVTDPHEARPTWSEVKDGARAIQNTVTTAAYNGMQYTQKSFKEFYQALQDKISPATLPSHHETAAVSSASSRPEHEVSRCSIWPRKLGYTILAAVTIGSFTYIVYRYNDSITIEKIKTTACNKRVQLIGGVSASAFIVGALYYTYAQLIAKRV